MTGGFDRAALADAVARNGTVVRVLVLRTKGSVPREIGTDMLVFKDGQSGTIGGGALEWEAAARGRSLLGSDGMWLREKLDLPLGPALGQCCGGFVEVLFERFGPEEVAWFETWPMDVYARPMTSGAPPEQDAKTLPLALRAQARALRAGNAPLLPVIAEDRVSEGMRTAARALFLYGAGHVARALVHVLADLPNTIYWVDDAQDRFPEAIPPHANPLLAKPMADAVAHAPEDADHLVMTYSHTADLEICHRVLSRRFRTLGLIGSETKRARFRSRLSALGHAPGQIDRMTCPIGDKSLGKTPAAIAIGVAATLIRDAETSLSATTIGAVRA